MSSFALLGVGLWGDRRRPGSREPIDLALMIACSMLAAPTVWTHHYGVTLPVFALALPEWVLPCPVIS